ncbi:hypothetical protein MMC10_010962 [Thelotrema lepadinum]|nr:hypothetical protein [Thelotrema lepadinum]
MAPTPRTRKRINKNKSDISTLGIIKQLPVTPSASIPNISAIINAALALERQASAIAFTETTKLPPLDQVRTGNLIDSIKQAAKDAKALAQYAVVNGGDDSIEPTLPDAEPSDMSDLDDDEYQMVGALEGGSPASSSSSSGSSSPPLPSMSAPHLSSPPDPHDMDINDAENVVRNLTPASQTTTKTTTTIDNNGLADSAAIQTAMASLTAAAAKFALLDESSEEDEDDDDDEGVTTVKHRKKPPVRAIPIKKYLVPEVAALPAVKERPVDVHEKASSALRQLGQQWVPSMAKAVLILHAGGRDPKGSKKLRHAKTNIMGCWLSGGKAARPLVRIKGLAAQNVSRLAVRAFLTKRQQQAFFKRAFHASHRCHTRQCFNPVHIIVESSTCNEKRNDCLRRGKCKCKQT